MEWEKNPEGRDRDQETTKWVLRLMLPANPVPWKTNPKKIKKKKYQMAEKVPNGRESVLVNSLTPRVDHAVPITLPRATEGEEKDDEQEEEETDLDILMSLMEQQDSNVTGLPVFKLF